MGCNLREVYSRHTAATSASAESQSRFPSGVGGAEGGPSNKLGPRARGRQLAVEETSSKKLDATVELAIRPYVRPVDPSVTRKPHRGLVPRRERYWSLSVPMCRPSSARVRMPSLR